MGTKFLLPLDCRPVGILQGLMDYLEEERHSIGTRSLEGFPNKIHLEYGHTQEVERMEKLREMLFFNRRPDWGIRAFWRKFRRLGFYDTPTGVEFPADVEFTQMMYALSLCKQQSERERELAVAHFETNRLGKNLKNPQAVTIRFFGSYLHSASSTSAFPAENVDEGYEESSDCENEEMLAGKRRPKKKSRPGYEDLAVKRGTNVLNMPHGQWSVPGEPLSTMFGEKAGANPGADRTVITTEGCLRCVPETHFWRSCPHPFRKELMFTAKKPVATGREVGGKSANVPTQRKTWVSGEVDGGDQSVETASQDAPNASEPDVDDTLPRVDYLESFALGDDMHASWVCSAL